MASVTLSVPEHSLREFCDFLDYGLASFPDSGSGMIDALMTWVENQRECMKRWDDED